MAGNPWQSYYDELVVGEEYTSIARTITETDLVAYANATGCWFPLHTDREFAERTRFGEPVVQGTFLLGLAEGLLFTNRPSGIRANAGIDDVSFERPVFVGDTVRFRVRVLDTEDVDEETGIVTVEIRGLKEDGDAFLEYENRLLMVTREAADE
ncbi:MaoC family dehydratase [Natronomonas marina]|jgi:3-hydroxybutyryl-CoA dehydratase|uniref:MaoC family dehydratase n=1 Tax=Natronomonas marina TaxID=2961939 RepID=UPI0020C96FA0|nr:MaoC/PaaZ C-terminal domain-containing protein [Natronomonas marina]